MHEQFSIAEALEQERDVLMPMIPAFDGYVETLGKVSSGGDRVMARVLNAVRQTSISGVMVAVELVLERGAVNAESIENMLNRLRQPLAPENVETALSVNEAPRAAPGRYDSLRVEGSHA